MKKHRHLIGYVLMLCAAPILLLLAGYAVEKNAMFHCHQLRAQAVVYSEHFFITRNEQKMCDTVGVPVAAPVK